LGYDASNNTQGSPSLWCLGKSGVNVMILGSTDYVALDRQAKFWQEKACLDWYNDGDRGTKFFHAVVIRTMTDLSFYF